MPRDIGIQGSMIDKEYDKIGGRLESATILKETKSQPVNAGIYDLVNHPKHYTFGKYEVIDVLQDWFPNEPLLWQVVKYVARANHKGLKVQDLEKARFYLNKAIEEECKTPKNQINGYPVKEL